MNKLKEYFIEGLFIGAGIVAAFKVSETAAEVINKRIDDRIGAYVRLHKYEGDCLKY